MRNKTNTSSTTSAANKNSNSSMGSIFSKNEGDENELVCSIYLFIDLNKNSFPSYLFSFKMYSFHEVI